MAISIEQARVIVIDVTDSYGVKNRYYWTGLTIATNKQCARMFQISEIIEQAFACRACLDAKEFWPENDFKDSDKIVIDARPITVNESEDL